MPSINLVKTGLIVKKESLFFLFYLNLRTLCVCVCVQCVSFDCISTLTSTTTLSRWFAISSNMNTSLKMWIFTINVQLLEHQNQSIIEWNFVQFDRWHMREEEPIIQKQTFYFTNKSLLSYSRLRWFLDWLLYSYTMRDKYRERSNNSFEIRYSILIGG